MSKKFKFNQGQTLIEVVFAIGVLSLCLVALVSIIVRAIGNASFSKHSALAVHYSQEGLEQARARRDRNDWDTFKGTSDGCEAIDIFQRCFTYTIADDAVDDNKVHVLVEVNWQESGRTHSVSSETFFTKWNSQ